MIADGGLGEEIMPSREIGAQAALAKPDHA
jgi:hypothetical protein